MKVEESMKGLDYVAIARSYGLNNAKIAKRLYAKAMDITRALTGNLPQDVLESKFGDELLNNYQDLLRDSKNKQWRENVGTKDKLVEGEEMKNKTKIREYVEGNMNIDELISEFDLEEEQSNPSYTQAIMKDRTVMKKKKKEYATNDGKPNTGDLDGENGFGTSYADDGTNAYGVEDDKKMIVNAEPYPMGNSVVEESIVFIEKTIDHDKGTVTMTSDEWEKVHKDYRGKRDGKDTALVMTPKGSVSYTVVIKD